MEGPLSQSQSIQIPSPRKRVIIGGGIKPSRKPVSRVLFGCPDPVKMRETLLNAVEACHASFRERWNFDPVTGLPCPLERREGETEEEGHGSHRYLWTRVLSPDGEENEEEDLISSLSPSLRRRVRKLSSVTNKDPSWAANQSRRRDAYEQRGQSSPLDKKSFNSTLHQKSIKDYMRVKKGTVFRPETKPVR